VQRVPEPAATSKPATKAPPPATRSESSTTTAATQTTPEKIDVEELISGLTRRHIDTLARRLHGSLQRMSRDDMRHSRERGGQWRDGRR
jgi:hypothetical protein